MIETIQRFSSEKAYPVFAALQAEGAKLAGHARETVDWLDHSVQVLTDGVLPPGAQTVVRATVQSFPYLAFYLLLPSFVAVPVYGALLVHQIYTESPDRSRLYNAVGFSALLSALDTLSSGGTLFSPTRLASVAAKAFFSTLVFKQSGLLPLQGSHVA